MHIGGWWECRCGREWWDWKTIQDRVDARPSWRECWCCGNPVGRFVFGKLLQRGHAVPWWVDVVPKWLLLTDLHRRAREVHDGLRRNQKES
jgi:hypothetical protein